MGVLLGAINVNSTERIRIEGKDYLGISDWARAKRLEVNWIKREGSFQLSNSASKMIFDVDSREAKVNGVGVWLSFPVVVRNGSAYLAQIDLQTMLEPLLSPPRNRSGSRIKSICLDPGHGGKDPGNQVGGNLEKKYTLLLAQEVRDQLSRAGFKATLTRTGDSYLELDERPDLARRRGADLFVSLHFNSAETSRNSVHGSEVYCLTPVGASSTNARGEGSGAGWFPGNRFNDKNLFLAYQIQKSLTRALGSEDRGVRRARFAVLREAVMPAVLIEAGFMSHPVEGKKIFDAAYRKQMARAIVEGIMAYKREVESPND
jgi:N-acetylmuramoyl-L-alanine amidase